VLCVTALMVNSGSDPSGCEATIALPLGPSPLDWRICLSESEGAIAGGFDVRVWQPVSNSESGCCTSLALASEESTPYFLRSSMDLGSFHHVDGLSVAVLEVRI
jgi:hypothetical protein